MMVHAAANNKNLSPFEVFLKRKKITEITESGRIKDGERSVSAGASCRPMCRPTGKIRMRAYSAITLGSVNRRIPMGSLINPRGADTPNMPILNIIKTAVIAICGSRLEYRLLTSADLCSVNIKVYINKTNINKRLFSRVKSAAVKKAAEKRLDGANIPRFDLSCLIKKIRDEMVKNNDKGSPLPDI